MLDYYSASTWNTYAPGVTPSNVGNEDKNSIWVSTANQMTVYFIIGFKQNKGYGRILDSMKINWVMAPKKFRVFC